MSMARRRLKSPKSVYGTSTHPSIVTHRSWSWMIKIIKAISNFDLETTRSMSWVWSKAKTIQSAQYLIDLLSFCFTYQITISEIQLFWNLTLKNQRSRSLVRSKVKATLFTLYPTDAPPFFRFTSIRPTIPEICQIECLILKKHSQNFQRKFAKRVSLIPWNLIKWWAWYSHQVL